MIGAGECFIAGLGRFQTPQVKKGRHVSSVNRARVFLCLHLGKRKVAQLVENRLPNEQ